METQTTIYIRTLLSVRFATLNKLIEHGANVDEAEAGYSRAVNDISAAILALIDDAQQKADGGKDGKTNA